MAEKEALTKQEVWNALTKPSPSCFTCVHYHHAHYIPECEPCFPKGFEWQDEYVNYGAYEYYE